MTGFIAAAIGVVHAITAMFSFSSVSAQPVQTGTEFLIQRTLSNSPYIASSSTTTSETFPK